jgi:predicted AAA+ superfamily ATPase
MFYWSEGNYEVDFIREVDGQVIAYEVKSGLKQKSKSLLEFRKRYPEAIVDVIDGATVEGWFNRES